jgi:hypothetical protein
MSVKALQRHRHPIHPHAGRGTAIFVGVATAGFDGRIDGRVQQDFGQHDIRSEYR